MTEKIIDQGIIAKDELTATITVRLTLKYKEEYANNKRGAI